MERYTLEKFFTGKTFIIPSYQRDYAWTRDNVDDLLNDIAETIETNTSHYIGTFILSKAPSGDTYSIVDGQQRLTTLTLILNAIVKLLPQEQQIIWRNMFIQDLAKKTWRLTPAAYNHGFLISLLDGHSDSPISRSQKLLLDANTYINEYVQELHKAKPNGLEAYLHGMKHLEVMEFVEGDEGKAIRMFQTVNDRGRPLAVIEKAKSLLIYYSNRFLDGQFDKLINDSFGEIFRDFSQIKEIGEAEETKIDLLASSSFTEDSVLRYHFLSFENDYYDFKPNTDYILDGFLKKTLRENQGDKQLLAGFIQVYVMDLQLFFHAFYDLIRRAQSDPRYFKIFCNLQLSANLYPLLIRLQRRNLLDMSIADNSFLRFIDLIETADVRIYKTRGTDPRKDISYLACSAAKPEVDKKIIRDQLGKIFRLFMDDARFESQLLDDMYQNEAVLHILWEYGEYWAAEGGKPAAILSDLIKLKMERPTIEHIFSQIPTFNFPSRGYENTEQYERQNNCLGNLSILEKELNSRCQNKTPEQKLADAILYKQSQFLVTRALVAEHAAKTTDFSEKDVCARTLSIALFAKKRWPLW